MRGEDQKQEAMFSYVSPEKRVPEDHPLRGIREMVDTILKEMSPRFARLYSEVGWPSIAPERLLRALLLQIFYSVRSERLLVEQLQYNLLFRWFVGMDLDEEVWNHAVFSKHGEPRRNETHQSTTDPEARLYKKSKGSEAKLSYLGHALMENRNGLLVKTLVTEANGTAERDAALLMAEKIPGVKRVTLGGDKN